MLLLLRKPKKLKEYFCKVESIYLNEIPETKKKSKKTLKTEKFKNLVANGSLRQIGTKNESLRVGWESKASILEQFFPRKGPRGLLPQRTNPNWVKKGIQNGKRVPEFYIGKNHKRLFE